MSEKESTTILLEAIKKKYNAVEESVSTAYISIKKFRVNEEVEIQIKNKFKKERGQLVLCKEKGDTTKTLNYDIFINNTNNSSFRFDFKQFDKNKPLEFIEDGIERLVEEGEIKNSDNKNLPNVEIQKSLPKSLIKEKFDEIMGYMKEKGKYQIYSADSKQFICGAETEEKLIKDVQKKKVYSEGDEFVIVSLSKNDEGVVIHSKRVVANKEYKLIVKQQFDRVKTWGQIEKSGFSENDVFDFVCDTIDAKFVEDKASTKLTGVKKLSKKEIADLRKYAKKYFHMK